MNCIICKDSTDEKLITVTDRGFDGLLQFSKARKEDLIYKELCLAKANQTQVLVHGSCRKWFNNKRRISTEEPCSSKKTRKILESFCWKSNCFYCGLQCISDRKNPSRKDWHLVSTLDIRKRILDICISKLECNAEDSQTLLVQSRVMSCIDLVASEARYHQSCSLGFQTLKETGKPKQKGRPRSEDMMDAFQKTCEWLESSAEVVTLTQFRMKMIEIAQKEDVYDKRYLQKLLKDNYQAHIFFSDHLKGKETLLCFQDMANFIINKKFKEREIDIENETKRIIKAAVSLIKAEIRNKEYRTDVYPTSDEIKDEWIPESLRLFLSMFTNSTIKQESIGQCIVKAAASTKIPPMMFALGVEVDHLFGSRWLNDELFKLGFAISYSEVTRFKQASLSQPVNDQMKRFGPENNFTHFIADNVDHNIRTLDGYGTFHGMGIVAATVSNREHVLKEVKLKRPDRLLMADEVTAKGSKVTIVNYQFPKNSLFEKILFKPRLELLFPYVLPLNLSTDNIWIAAGLFSTKENPRPNWSGYMQDISTGSHPPKSTITMLPIIDLNPSDMTCIYSTLLFVIDQSKKLNVITPSITFDQPLWYKALQIANIDVVCK